MSGSAVGQRLWFLDTASLLSMAVDKAIAAAVLAEIGDDTVIIIDVVLDELDHRASVASTAGLAMAAVANKQPHWIDMETTSVPLADIAAAQEDVADGRVLTDEYQHWAESTIIAMGRQSAAAGSTSIKILLSEDYDARRVATGVDKMEALSIHRLLHQRVHAKRVTAKAAAELAGKLYEVRRGPVVTEHEFADPSGRLLGRVGRP